MAMTRNEFIATTAARLWATPEAGSANNVVLGAVRLAAALEIADVAPWRDQPPAPSSAAMRVVATGIAWEEDPDCSKLTQAHLAAVRAYKESVQ